MSAAARLAFADQSPPIEEHGPTAGERGARWTISPTSVFVMLSCGYAVRIR